VSEKDEVNPEVQLRCDLLTERERCRYLGLLTITSYIYIYTAVSLFQIVNPLLTKVVRS